ncbi:MAG: tetratricopeptide repeat protein [Desulfococcaceae bacterium]
MQPEKQPAVMGINEALHLAFQFHQKGKLPEAEDIYLRILSVNPNHADALHLLGLMDYHKGQYAAAADKIGRAIRVNPGNAAFYSNMGSALKCMGNLEQAADFYLKSLEINPGYADAHYNLGVTLKALGRTDDAIACYQKAVDLKPDYCEAYANLGSAFRDLGRIDDAIAFFRKALEINPSYLPAYNNMGNAFKDRGELGQALACYRKALETDPAYVKTLVNMGNIFNDMGKLDDASACFAKVRETEPDSHWAAAGQAKVQMRKGDFAGACDLLLPLMQSGTDNIDAVITFAQVSPRFGHQQSAIAFLEKRLRGYIGDSDSLRQMYFSLGYLYDKNQEYDRAFAYYQKANALRPRNFDPQQHENHISSLIRSYPHNAERITSDNDSRIPVFILGMPRSGTTLVEQILSAHPQVFGAGELPHISNIVSSLHKIIGHAEPYPNCISALSKAVLNSLTAQYLTEIRKFSSDALRITDKMPANFLYIGLISQLFPKAAIIHCNRNPKDTALSVYFQNFLGSHTYSFDLESIGIYYREYARLMRHWQDLPGISLLNVCYEELVENPEKISRQMLDFIGLEWDEICLKFYQSERSVMTSSFQQVREPIYKQSAGRWKHYEKYLKPFADALHSPGRDENFLISEALKCHQKGQPDQARSLYAEILSLNPNHSDALHLLGLIEHQQGKQERAESLIRKSIAINPANPVAYFNLAIILKKQGNYKEAAACYQKVVDMQPAHADAWFNLGNTLATMKKTEEAVSCYQKNLELASDSLMTWMNLGKALKELGKNDDSLACYRKGAEIRPEYAPAYFSMGNTLKEMGKSEEAVGCYRKAVELKLDYSEAHCNLGLALQEQKKYDGAIAAFRKCAELSPDNITARSSLVFLLKYLCDWTLIEKLSSGLDKLIQDSIEKSVRPDEAPFMNLVRNADPGCNFALAKIWARDISRTVAKYNISFSFDDRRVRKEKITIGYLSNDFRNHPVAHLIAGLFTAHNRNRFRIIAYSYGENDSSFYRNKIEKDCDLFVDLRPCSTEESAKQIYANQTDILLDLMGYTTDARMEICALHPAPVQAAFLGYPGTTGADYMDYIITDRIVTPEEHRQYFSEKFVYMPHAYQINDSEQKISDKQYTRADAGLPENAFVFCSFNQVYKIEPVVFDVWMKILRQVPQSVLWLMSGGPGAENILRREAANRGVAAERLFFAQRMSKEEHLSRSKLGELFLDTRIVNGHTTTSDALWSGLPAITVLGTHFASRVSASLLHAVGLPELVTHSLEEYEALAVRLACKPEELRGIREKLAVNRLREPLFDTRRYAANLEKAFENMWEIFLAGEKPRMIAVKE